MVGAENQGELMLDHEKLKGLVAVACLGAATNAFAQVGQDKTMIGDVSISVAQRAWLASWNSKILGARPGAAAGTAEAVSLSDRSTEILWLTSISAAYDRAVLSLTVSPRTTYDNRYTADGDISRSEYDINLGYSLSPYFTPALIYKGGKTRSGRTIGSPISDGNDLKLSLWMLGVSGNFPIPFRGASGFDSPLTAYGTVAHSFNGRTRTGDGETTSLRYAIGEIGLSYRPFAGSTSAVAGGLSMQIGYRIQAVTSANVPFNTFGPSGVVVASREQDIRSVTKGLVIGLRASF